MFSIEQWAMLPWAIILGLLGSTSIQLLKMWKTNKWADLKSAKTVASLALGPIAAGEMWMMGDGAQIIGILAYFLAGATGETFLVGVLDKYTDYKIKKKEEKDQELENKIKKILDQKEE